MLLSFRVENHRSLRAEQELVLTPVYDKSRPVVPVAAIFGANASGKSNLLDALRFMQHAVRRSFAEWEDGIPRTPFLLDPAAQDLPSGYVVQLLLDGVRHIYGFEIDDHRVRAEWLYAFPNNRRQVIFDREGQEIHPGPTSGPSRRQVTAVKSLLPESALFLTVAARASVEQVADVYRWFADKLDLIMEEHRDPDEHELALQLDNDPDTRERVIELIRAADMGVEHITTDWTTEGKKRLLFHHAPYPDKTTPLLRLNEQAHGTRVWLSYVLRVLRALDRGSVLVIDEIELSLHPRLTERFVALFQETESNRRGAQLIVTSHDSTLLLPFLGEDILARDEIWFVSKDREGMTNLYPLSDFKPRKHEATQSRYLTGTYGAIPQLFDVEFYQAVWPHPGDDARAAG